jgi:peptidoglycan/xylan/chitin deacetylase (PgdA/CDA1 family)
LAADHKNKKILYLRLSRKIYVYLSYYSGLNWLTQQYQKRYGTSIKVILYHNIDDNPNNHDIFTVSTINFEEQMKYVSQNYQVISFSDAIRMKNLIADTPESLVIINFDDGYKSNITKAVPILEKYGLKACFFLTTGLIGHVPRLGLPGEDIWRTPGMTWDDVKYLRDHGFEIGSHTCSHPNLKKIPLDMAHQEIMDSKQQLEHRLGEEVGYFSYPFGKKNQAIEDIVAKGYRLCAATSRRRNNLKTMDLMNIHRICVQTWWSPFYFARELEGTFDFVRSFPFGS